jgi:hypothetical protein
MPYVDFRHFLWIGDRTRDINGAHVEYFRNIRNPIGLKAGPTLSPDELVRLLDILDPHLEPGKVTIICRYGASKVNRPYWTWRLCSSPLYYVMNPGRRLPTPTYQSSSGHQP